MLAPSADLDPSSTALLFDFDGTLVEIAAHPDAVVLDERTANALRSLADAVDGAVAIVSGRPIHEIDRHLSPHIPHIHAAGVHGLEFRGESRTIERHPFDTSVLTKLNNHAQRFARRHEGLFVEGKQGSVAIHYRQRPDLEMEVRAAASNWAAGLPGVDLVAGKMVVELRLGGRDKGDAISHIMDAPAFRGRTPWYFGDDVTDEDGFRFVNSVGGRSFRIGGGPTAAATSFMNFDAFQHWLIETADRVGRRTIFEGGNTAGIGSMR